MEVKKYLLNKGISPQIKGFTYLENAIKLCKDNKKYLWNLTTILYPEISRIYGDTYSRVERAMRHAISKIKPYKTIGAFIGTALIELGLEA